MTVNVGGMDRVLRLIVGVALLSLFFVAEGNARAWSLAGVVLLFTSVSGFCPMYKLVGINTCRKS
jgi:hypothetical protein